MHHHKLYSIKNFETATIVGIEDFLEFRLTRLPVKRSSQLSYIPKGHNCNISGEITKGIPYLRPRRTKTGMDRA